MREWILCNNTSIESLLNKAKSVFEDDSLDLYNLADKIAQLDTSVTESIIDGSIVEFINEELTSIRFEFFYLCKSLVKVHLPELIILPESLFYACNSLESVYIPKVTEIGSTAFTNCSSLSQIDLPSITAIGSSAFFNCTSLSTIILRSNTVCSLAHTLVFGSTPIASGTGYIYVPKNLIDSYKTASNWSTYANQFRAIEDYPDICDTEEV